MRSGSVESGRGLMGPKLPFSIWGRLRNLFFLLGGPLRGALVAWAGAPKATDCTPIQGGPLRGWPPVGGAEASAPSWAWVVKGLLAGAWGWATGAIGALARAR